MQPPSPARSRLAAPRRSAGQVLLAWASAQDPAWAQLLRWPRRAGLWSQAELAQGATLRPDRRCGFWLSRALLRGLVQQVLPRGAAMPALVHLPGQAPTLGPGRHGRALSLSLAHTAGAVLVGLRRGGRLGVDLEPGARVLARPQGLLRRLDARERRWLAGLSGPAQARALLRLWTLKEATGKALGRGLGLPLRASSFAALGPSGQAVTALVPPGPAPWRWWQGPIGSAWQGALALPDAARPDWIPLLRWLPTGPAGPRRCLRL